MHQISPAAEAEPATAPPHLSGASSPCCPLALATLFSAAPLPAHAVGSEGGRALWAAEAAHRANNLAQLANSLAGFRWRNKSEMIPRSARARAEALARAYTMLSGDQDSEGPLPCNQLLRQVLAGLVAMFGSAGVGVGLRLGDAELFLAPDRRRALVLIASELVINALKHAFPEPRSGMIQVSLSLDECQVELAIEDDGVGLAGSRQRQGGEGQGGQLLKGLAVVLGGTISRDRSPAGGLRARLRFIAGCVSPGSAETLKRNAAE